MSGMGPSVETWRLLREVRNSLAHDYPDQPALQAAAWNRLHAAIDDLLAVWRAVVTFRARVNPGS